MMMIRRDAIKNIIVCCLTLSLASYATIKENLLSLTEAENLAIGLAPELKQLQAKVDSLEEQAIVDGELPDPKLIAGAANVPTNSFSLTKDDMTMVQIGLQQTFVPGNSLAIKAEKTKTLARAEQQGKKEQTAMLLRNVREIWLDLYYWQQAKHIIQNTQSLYESLLKLNESEYSTGKRNQSEVLQLKVELSRLDDQDIQIDQKIKILHAQLARLIGASAEMQLTNSLPSWSDPPAIASLESNLRQHPLLQADLEKIQAARSEVALSEEQYKPGWTVDVSYAARQGKMQNGESRSNFIGAQIMVDLPLFTGNRQDRALRSSSDRLLATQFERDIHYKDLTKEITIQYAIWQSLVEREKLYSTHLKPQAKQNSKASLSAYKNTTADLSTVLRAYSNELTIGLEQIQIQVDRAKARAALFYLEGIIG